jgi:hypothetical protein
MIQKRRTRSLARRCRQEKQKSSLGFRVVFVAGALPPHPHKELSFFDFVHFGVPFLKKGNKKNLTTQDTKEPQKVVVYV